MGIHEDLKAWKEIIERDSGIVPDKIFYRGKEMTLEEFAEIAVPIKLGELLTILDSTTKLPLLQKEDLSEPYVIRKLTFEYPDIPISPPRSRFLPGDPKPWKRKKK